MTTVTHQPHMPPDTPLVRSSEKFLRRFLWLLIVYSFAVWLISLVDWLRHPLALSPYSAFGGSPVFRAFAIFVGAPIITICSGLILKKQKQNIVGLLLLAWGAGGFASFGISDEIEPALYMLVSLPIGAWWFSLVISPCYFPDGHAYPRRLSPLLPAILVLALVFGFSSMLTPAQLDFGRNPPNPFYVPGVEPISQLLGMLILVAALGLIIGVIGSPLFRYRQADFLQRQQIKWFVYWSMMVFAPYLLFYFVIGYLFFEEGANVPPIIQLILQALIGIIGLFPPIIIAVAILRHRLYDIDIIIRKTLVYALLTVSLALAYFGSIILLQSLVGRVTDEQSPIIIVFSTLFIAALFTPLRRRIQDFIDRRFYRRKYDAARTLAQFAQTARDEVDMDRLSAALVSVVQETMQPERTTLWLLKPKGLKKT